MSKKKPTLGVCMIVKNEERLLEACLKSVADIVDEIVVVDTGSTDSTIDIAKKYSANIYSYPWDNSFSNARNFSISKSTCRWILLLDADEQLFNQDKDKLLDFITTTDKDGAHFKIYNFVGEGNGSNYTFHNALRLIKNSNQYKFYGDIHEQYKRISGKTSREKFAVLDIRINHYGYLDGVVKEKDKRKRNIPLLLKQLEKTPDDTFAKFNLGNEYLAQGEHEKALEIYQDSMKSLKINEAYTPHLFHRASMCLYALKRYDEAVTLLSQGLAFYPQCTDMEYLKGLILADKKRYTLAIDSFNKALSMGEAPSSLLFTDFCDTTKPLLSLGRLYLKLHDYQRALDSFTKLINMDNTLYFVLYYIAEALNKIYEDKQIVETKLSAYFGSLEHLPNLIVFTDILIEQKLFAIAQKYILKLNDFKEHEDEKKLLCAKYNFLTANFQEAKQYFYELASSENSLSWLMPDIKRSSTLYLFALSLIYDKEAAEELFPLVSKNCGEPTEKILTQCYNVVFDIKEDVIPKDDDIEHVLAILSEFLNIILKAKEFDLFEKLLYVYNYLDTDKVLFSLAQLYYNNGLNDLALNTLTYSIKEFGIVDGCVDLLYDISIN